MSGTLQVTKNGTGSGNVRSLAGGIDCGGDCSERYTNSRLLPPAVVSLSASPDSGSVFAGWSGDGTTIQPTGNRVVVMDANRNVTATFNLSSGTGDRRADLVVQNLRVIAPNVGVHAGTAYQVECRVTNIGARPSGACVVREMLIESDEVVVNGQTTQQVLDMPPATEREVPILLPGQWRSFTFSHTLSQPESIGASATAVRRRRLVISVLADSRRAVNEASEQNNGAAITGIMTKTGFVQT